MLSREERKEWNKKFWDEFRKEMRSMKSSNGRSINWINYPTDVKDVYLRLETDGKGARLCLDIQPKDDGIRSLLWEQMTELKKVMENQTGPAEWNEFDHIINGRTCSRISWKLDSVNFYNVSDWYKIKSFLKGRLVQFDDFYQEYKEILIHLAD